MGTFRVLIPERMIIENIPKKLPVFTDLALRLSYDIIIGIETGNICRIGSVLILGDGKGI